MVVAGIPTVSRCIIAKKSAKDIVEEKKVKEKLETHPWIWAARDDLWELIFNKDEKTEDNDQNKQEEKQNPPVIIKKEEEAAKKEEDPKKEEATKKEEAPKKEELKLLIEGLGLKYVLGLDGIKYTETVSNHSIEAEQVLGIEAARSTLINQLNYTMKEHGVAPDIRHLMLLADIMTFRGKILGFTRTGIAEMKDSLLMLASFERTTDFIFDAAAYSLKEHVAGVSERIIMGTDIPLGTGIFSLLQKHSTSLGKAKAKKILLDDTDFKLTLKDIIRPV